MDVPKLADRDEALRFIRDSWDRGYYFYWSKEAGRLGMNPHAMPSVPEKLTALLRLKSDEDWQVVRVELGLGRTQPESGAGSTGQRFLSVREEKERNLAFLQLEGQDEPRCPYCGRDFKTLNAAKGHITRRHIGKDWIGYPPLR